MGKILKKYVHEGSTDSPTPGSVENPDADQLEVPSEPGLGDLAIQHLLRVIGPPLAMLSRVAVGEADKHCTVVRAGKTKAIPDAVLVPDGGAPCRAIRVVAEYGLVHGPHRSTVVCRCRIVDT